MKMKNSNFTLKLAISSVSLLVMTYSSISIIMADLIKAFPHVDPTVVQSVLTISALAIVFGTLLTGLTAEIVGKRKLLLLGIALYTLGGIAPLFFSSFEFLMAARVLLGAGIGIMNPIATALIGDFFQGGADRAQLVGFKSTAGGLGQTIFPIFMGILAVSGWRNVFWVYLFGLLILAVVYFYIPEPPKPQVNGAKAKVKDFYKINFSVIAICLFVFSAFVAHMAIFTNTAIFMVQSGLGNTSSATVAITVLSAAHMFMSLIFKYSSQIFKKFVGPIGTAMLALGLLIMANAQSMTVVSVAMIFMGIGAGTYIPYAYDLITNLAPNTSRSFCISLMLIFLNFGGFLSPFIMTFTASALGNNTSGFKMLIAAVIFLVLTASTLPYAMKSSQGAAKA